MFIKLLCLFSFVLSSFVEYAVASQRYIVTFKEGAQLSDQSFDSSIQTIKFLDHLQMSIVESDSANAIDVIKRNKYVANVETEILFTAPNLNSVVSSNSKKSDESHLPLIKKWQTPVELFSDLLQTKQDTWMSVPVGQSWGVFAVKAPEAWNFTQGQGARVAVLDTGVDRDHPAISRRIEKGKNFFIDESDAHFPYEYFDENGHGTHVSGIIAADGLQQPLMGVAPQAQILVAKVCRRFCSNAAIVAALNWAIDEKVDVINISLGGLNVSEAAKEAFAKAEAKNIVVVAATGNGGTAQVSYPAALDSVIAVGAVDQKFIRADFSQYGPELDVVAPGVEIYSSVPLGKGRLSRVLIDSSKEIVSDTVIGSGVGDVEASEVVPVFGHGLKRDFENADVKQKIVMLSRGGLSFADKVDNAIAAGARGVIIYNNQPGRLKIGLNVMGLEVAVPVISLNQQEGQMILDRLNVEPNLQLSMSVEKVDYENDDGTSMAAPHVSGVVALMKAVNSRITPQQVRLILKNSAIKINCSIAECGSGLVNANEAVKQAIAQ